MKKNNYKFCQITKSPIKTWLLVVLMMFGLWGGLKAQVSNYTFAQSTGTYTPITGGTVLATAAANNDLDSGVYPIANGSFPFSFTFNGVAYTGCNVNSNGYITFGATAPLATTSTGISSTEAYAGAIAAWSRDINGMFSLGGRTSDISWTTVGTAPNREIIIQYKDFRPTFSISTTNAFAINFQIRLNENNNVSIVYGQFLYTVGTTNISQTTTGPQVGLRGATNADFNNRTGGSWATSTAGTTNSQRNAFQTLTAPVNLPANGLRFTWTPPVICSGMPTAGTASSSLSSICAGTNVNFNIAGTTVASGITFQWQSATSLAGPYTNIVGATTRAYVASIPPNGGWFRAVVTCTNSAQSIETNAFEITVIPAAYATIPLTESFEATWATTCVVAPLGEDAVNNSWRTSPTSTNLSWRADNTTTALSGWSGTSNVYTPIGASGSARSARFTSSRGTNGGQGNFDLYLNMSTSGGNASLSFDYIDPNGAVDKLDVLISTDGGLTFSSIAGLQNLGITDITAWTNFSAVLTSIVSPTTIIRFRGTADNSFTTNGDLGIDNVLINLPCSGTPTTGTAIASISSLCAGGSSVLSLTGASTSSGITYQWQSSPNGIAPYVNIASATSSTLSLTNITASAFYRCVVSCTPSAQIVQTNAVQITVIFSTYATIPLTESFEATWATTCAVAPLGQDTPDASWRTVNTSGDPDANWRADNITTALSGWSGTSGMYSPAAQNGVRSARFHSFDVTAGLQGSLDLYVDLSATGTKQLSFWYINPTSTTDRLEVLLSTDGGGTFSTLTTTPVMAAGGTAVTTWTNVTASLATTSATCVIRFRATGDSGSGAADIDLDNVSIIPSCPSAPAAVTVTQPTCSTATGTFQITGFDLARIYTFAPTVVSISTTGLVTANAGTYTFTVDNALGCTSVSSANIIVNAQPATPAATAATAQSFCGPATVANLVATGTDIKWYATAISVPALTSTTPLVAGNYFATQTVNGCESARTSVAITFPSTTWNGTAWSNGVPTSSTRAIFTGNFTAAANISACTVEISGTAVVTIPSSFNLTVNNEVTVASTAALNIENNANLIQTGTNANTGTITVKRNALMRRSEFVYWSSPVAGQNLLPFSPNTLTNRFTTYSEPTKNFVAVAAPSSTAFARAVGYSLRAPNDFLSAPTAPQAFTGIFTGVPNNGNITIPVTFTTGQGIGYNLIGNPYPSTLNATTFLTANTGSLYFWTHTVLNAGTSNYAVFNLTGATAATAGGAGVLPNGFIQVGQGFMFLTTTSKDVNFTNAMRQANNGNQFFRTSGANKDKYWLNVTNNDGLFSQSMVAYLPNTTKGFDDGYDAPQINTTGLSTRIDAAQYAIQARGTFDTADVVPLDINLDTEGNHTIAVDHTEGIFSADQVVYLKDNLLGTTHNLTQSPYNFAATKGTTTDRFVVVYESSLAKSKTTFNPETVIVFESKNLLNITSNQELKAVQIFDLQGRKLFEGKDFNSQEIVLTNFRSTHQVLIVKITNKFDAVVTKKILY